MQAGPVSILVLMEVTLKVVLMDLQVFYFPGFNPCFNGSDSKRMVNGAKRDRIMGFQSLF